MILYCLLITIGLWDMWGEKNKERAGTCAIWKLQGYSERLDAVEHESYKCFLLSSPYIISTNQRWNHIQRVHRHLFHKTVPLWLWFYKMCSWKDSVRNGLFSVFPYHKARCYEDGLIHFQLRICYFILSSSQKPLRFYLSVFMRKIPSYPDWDEQNGKPQSL